MNQPKPVDYDTATKAVALADQMRPLTIGCTNHVKVLALAVLYEELELCILETDGSMGQRFLAVEFSAIVEKIRRGRQSIAGTTNQDQCPEK